MDISFKDKKLEAYSNDYKKCRAKLGDKRAKIYMNRLFQLHNAESLEDVRNPIPTKDNKYVWIEILGVEIIEIVNYHKEK